jgi:hypothetical protein
LKKNKLKYTVVRETWIWKPRGDKAENMERCFMLTATFNNNTLHLVTSEDYYLTLDPSELE